jgi:HD superfamily phosphohydrolase
MKYTDRVYGEFEITEPVILELINSPSLQRLKDIDQAGYRPLWVKPDAYTGEYDHSRFAHSLGVYLLLRKYDAPLEEQIAGLIHDASHSAFSHCIDYILDSGSEKEHNHQDNLFDNFIRKTEIPEIIKKYGFDLDYILNDKNFPLKERGLPDLFC